MRIKRITNNQKQQPADYCFVEFPSPQTAEHCVYSLHGKPMLVPQGRPPKNWRLNWGSRTTQAGVAAEYSVFVGDVTADVDDQTLTNFFRMRYPSVKMGTVQTDSEGRGKGYGFVRFGDKLEQIRAVSEMQGVIGCGQKPLRIGEATPKNIVKPVAYNPYMQSMVPMQAPYYPQQQATWPVMTSTTPFAPAYSGTTTHPQPQTSNLVQPSVIKSVNFGLHFLLHKKILNLLSIDSPAKQQGNI
eukprot:m.263136 g.263136  ORF g.263136 m.263136 type:complete len:243 (-) comp16226_c2_seq33:2992-3720(-)